MTENAFSAKRIGKLALMLLCSVLMPVVCGILKNARIDHMIVWIFMSLILFLCFALYAERERLLGEMSRGISNDYSLLMFVYLVCLAAACLASLLPLFTAPVMAIGALCNGAFQTKMGSALAVYFSLLTALFSGGNEYEMAAYGLLALVSLFLTELYLKEKR